jgi:hypothetical protein
MFRQKPEQSVPKNSVVYSVFLDDAEYKVSQQQGDHNVRGFEEALRFKVIYPHTNDLA